MWGSLVAASPEKVVICLMAAILYPHSSHSVQEAIRRARLLWAAYDEASV